VDPARTCRGLGGLRVFSVEDQWGPGVAGVAPVIGAGQGVVSTGGGE